MPSQRLIKKKIKTLEQKSTKKVSNSEKKANILEKIKINGTGLVLL